MPTTVDDVRAWMAAKLAEHGENAAVEFTDLAGEEFPDLTCLGEQRGEEARWGTRDWVVYSVDGGGHIGIQYYAAATEMQESLYEGTVEPMVAEVTTTWVPAR